MRSRNIPLFVLSNAFCRRTTPTRAENLAYRRIIMFLPGNPPD